MFVLATAEGVGDIRKACSVVNPTRWILKEAIGAMLATHAAGVMMTVNRRKEFETALASRDLVAKPKAFS